MREEAKPNSNLGQKGLKGTERTQINSKQFGKERANKEAHDSRSINKKIKSDQKIKKTN